MSTLTMLNILIMCNCIWYLNWKQNNEHRQVIWVIMSQVKSNHKFTFQVSVKSELFDSSSHLWYE